MTQRWLTIALATFGLNCKQNGRYKKAAFVKWILILMVLIFYINYKYNSTIVFKFINANSRSPCMLPAYDPFDSRLSDYFHPAKEHKCANWLDLMYIDYEGYLHKNETAIKISELGDVKCFYAYVIPKNVDEVSFSDDFFYEKPIYMTADYVRVQCQDKNYNAIYRTLLVSINYGLNIREHNLEKESKEKLSIYIFGIDSISGLVAKRKLPKTLIYLENTLHSYTLRGYTKVAPNSYPNLLAFFTGYSYEEWPEKYMKTAPYLWANFSNTGSPTLLAEDYHMIGTFKDLSPRPKHFMRDFFLATERLQPVLLSKAYEWLQRKEFLNKNSLLCFGNKLKHRIMIDYFKRFMQSYKSYRKFGMTWTSELLHDDLNLIGKNEDEDILNFLKWIKEGGHLENAVLILMGDHGPNFSEFQNTDIGRVSNLNPFISIALPDFIRKKYPNFHNNLKANTKLLTTHFDTFELLKNIFNNDYSEKGPLDSRNLPRGISLFRKIPKTRSCEDAGVSEHYCPCYTSKNISNSDARLKPIANRCVQKLNEMLSDLHNLCAKITFESIHHASIIYADMTRSRAAEGWKFSFRSYFFNIETPDRLNVAFSTQPGNALYQATVEYLDENNINILGEIDRINRYGNQSACIANKHRLRRQYCYCK